MVRGMTRGVALVFALAALTPAPAPARGRLGWGDMRALGALGRRLKDLDQGFQVPVTARVRTPTYEGELSFSLTVAKGEDPGLRVRLARPIASTLAPAMPGAPFQLDLTVDAAGLWVTARPVGEGAPARALALHLPVTGRVDPPRRARRRGRRNDVEAIEGGFRMRTQGKDGEPVEVVLRHDAGHWPTSFEVRQGEARELVLEFGTIRLGAPALAPPLPPDSYGPLDLVGLVRVAPLLADLTRVVGPLGLEDLFPVAPGAPLPPVASLPKISLARLARGERLGLPGLLKLASVVDEAEFVEGLRDGVRKLRGGLARSWAPPQRRGLLGRFRR